jgi:hypothetical protein
MLQNTKELDTEMFAQWFRCMFESSLNCAPEKCVELIKLSLNIVEASIISDDRYPKSELKWLFITGKFIN